MRETAVQNIECQLTQVQLKRFLEGDDLVPELLADLETHLRSCPACMAVAQGQRSALEDELDRTRKSPLEAFKSTFARAAVAAPDESHVDPADAILSKPGVDASRITLWQAFKERKTLMLTASLAVVLVAMTTLMRDPTKIFGHRLSEMSSPAVQPQTDTQPAPPDGEAGAAALDAAQADDAKPSLVGLHQPAAAPNGEAAASALADDKPGSAGAAQTSRANQAGGDLPQPSGKVPVETAANTDSARALGAAKEVPGKPTLSNDEILSVGGEAPPAPAKKSAPKAAPKKAGAHRASHSIHKPARSTHPRGKHVSPNRAKAHHARKKGAQAGSHIRVYDNNGRPLSRG